jgi:hypothetical protein
MSMTNPTNTSPAGAQGALTWLTSWLVIILVLVALAQVEWGKRIVYYVAWLSVVLLIVTHSSEFSSLLGTFGQTPDTIGQSGASGPGVPLPPGSLPPTGGIPPGKI